MRLKLLLMLAITALLIVACGGSSEPEVITEQVEVEVTRVVTETETVTETVVETETVTETVVEQVEVLALPAVDPLSVEGDINIAGSSTVFPLAERMLEVFVDEGYGGNAPYDSIGSGAGFERFCVAGESDVAGASRAIRDTEIESCNGIGREPIEFRVGTDALAVTVSAENDFVDSLTLEELALVFSTAETWADVNPDWPAEPIQRFIPGTDSGTFDYFVEEVFDEDQEPILASNPQLSEDDNVLVQGITGSPYAVGFFGYAYYQENADALKILSLEGVEANAENVDNGSYPLARPLFLYSDAAVMQEKPQVAAFLNFFLSNVNNEINTVGYFPASTAALNAAKQGWADAANVQVEAPTAAAGLPAVDPLSITGDINIAGSSTVFPLAERMLEVFVDEGYGGNAPYDSIGSGAGFERFCVAGESDVAGASRAIRDSEIESCGEIGRSPIEFRVGTDALAVTVSAENDFVDNLTLEELALVFSTAETWADVNPDWPAEPIQRFIPGTDSGTFDYFVEEVFDEDQEPILASNPQLSEDDNVLVQGITGSPYAVGFFGYAYYQENADALKILSLEGIEASAENVDNGSYPLARPLFLYSDASIIQDKPQVAGFLNFFLSNVNNEINTVGYFPANASVLDGAKTALAAAISGEEMMMEEEDMGMMLPEVDPLSVEGDINIAGSSTVFPLAERMLEVFVDEGYGGNAPYDSIGSGAGFERFCVAGESDVAGASRAIRDTEIESCNGIGREPIEFRVGTDALAVTVSAENDFVDNLTLEELALVFSTAETWADVNPDWPAEPIQRFIPGTDSGTFDYFVEEVFDEDQEPILASNPQLSEDDNVLVQGITGSPYAVGFFGYAYYQENADALKILSLEGIEASAENVDNGSYPLARPLFLYSDASIIQDKPQVAAFLNFFLSNVNEEIGAVGYFPANQAVLDGARAALADALP